MPDSGEQPSIVLRWDIFCQVIDNLGDLGICWRVAADLAQRGHSVRLWLDQPQALQWMAPGLHPNVQILPWRTGSAVAVPTALPPSEAIAGAAPATSDPPSNVSGEASEPLELGDAVIAAFSCELDLPSLRALGRRAQEGRPCAWLNLEYLSAESFSERAHGKPAPILHGPAQAAPRLAYYPGFTPATGGLLREPGLLERQARFDRAHWLARHGVDWQGQLLVSMFCYEPPMLPALLEHLATGKRETMMLVCAGRGAQAVRLALKGSTLAPHASQGHAAPSLPVLRLGKLTLHFLPALSQSGYDRLLWSCDLNFVRGEDSLVRAIWAGQAFVWQIYFQDDGAHHAKLRALLDRMDAPASLRAFMARWNGMADAKAPDSAAGLRMNEPGQLAAWSAATLAWRQTLLVQADLTSQLLHLATRAG